ncbi:unnamed protein product [Tenebrio molitor]|nr:unnamed protein product [Tenebrio molitor]
MIHEINAMKNFDGPRAENFLAASPTYPHVNSTLCMREPVMQFITPGVRSKWSKIFLQA